MTLQENRPAHHVCVECAYFQATDKTSGTCHRYPPTFSGDHSAQEHHHWRFPTVTTHAWCGEFTDQNKA